MRRPACIAGLWLVLFIGLLLRINPVKPFSDKRVDGQKITVVGKVSDKYQKNDSYYLVLKKSNVIACKGLDDSHEKYPDKNTDQNVGKDTQNDLSSEKINIVVKLDDEYNSEEKLPDIGCHVKVQGKGMLFSGARNPGNFDLAMYECVHDTDMEIYDSCILAYDGERNTFFEYMYRIRKRLLSIIDDIYGSEQGAVIKAMVIGDRTGLTDDIKAMYRRAGMSHILCISGLHISIIGLGVLRLLKNNGVNLYLSYLIALVVIMLYGAFTGMGISTARALIMFALIIGGGLCKRTPDILSSMSIACAIVLVIRPLYLNDAGFILSFAAIAGIGVLGPAMRILIPCKGIGLIRKAAEGVSSSIAVTLFMLPATLYFFFRIPLFSIPINLIVIPVLGVLLMMAIMSVAIGAVSPVMAMIPAGVVKIILAVFDKICTANDMMPGSVVTLGRPGVIRVVVYYLLIFAGVYITGDRFIPIIKRRCLTGAVFMVAIIVIVNPYKSSSLDITMIDIGQGDCNYIEQGGHNVMIDCGSTDINEAAKYRVVPFVMSRGYDSIDYAVATHMDEDHINGFLEILSSDEEEGLKIRNLIMPDLITVDDKYDRLVQKARERGIKVMMIHAGERFKVNDMTFTCLNPKAGEAYEDSNAASICLILEYRGYKVLFTGDVQGKGEEILSDLIGNTKIDLLKCAHHGSANSTTDAFLEKIRPDNTFISAGVNNPYGHPDKELLDRLDKAGSNYYVTNRSGALNLRTDGRHINIDTFIKEQG